MGEARWKVEGRFLASHEGSARRIAAPSDSVNALRPSDRERVKKPLFLTSNAWRRLGNAASGRSGLFPAGPLRDSLYASRGAALGAPDFHTPWRSVRYPVNRLQIAHL